MISACQQQGQHAILKEILSDPESLCRHEDGFVALLYVATVIDPRFIDTLVQIDPTVYDFVRSKYPTLVDEWLQNIRAGYVTLEQVEARERDSIAIRHELETWNHELAKKSVYTSWPPAQEYQRHIAEWLRAQFTSLPQRPSLDDPDDLIELLEETHNLERAEGTARRNMSAYIKAQLARLDAFDRFAQDYKIQGVAEFLAIPHEGLHERLKKESVHAVSVVRELYRLAIQEVSR